VHKEARRTRSRLDVAEVDGTRRRLAELDAEAGGVDMVIANAGVAGGRTIGASTDLPWEVTRAISAAYSASKAGLTHYLEALDIELRPKGVSVTIIHPGFVRTPAVEDIKGPLILMVETDTAVRIIERAIARRSRLVRFPWILGALYRWVDSLPGPIRDRLIRWAVAKGA
jgi:NAD(P)-dependent dehydrogenase (short-subunit alcohol dehydrogenase family)